ncbi:hypothetical protein CEE37_02455 [candidate division LCP-89 bacterium B3_LCP]|uniref:DUF3795 domain-containing protein n=1 Tax=candidate division LCP-89 bacterium B3_LCP TaxID=2012998 RepID=A0A532V5V2_UNCL8|nr:MAG: hypothetical protein CEE37_02455 [candidate division LCP-89 bacterium B3_LCP]
MENSKDTLDRRRFLKTTGAVCIASCLPLALGCSGKKETGETAKSSLDKEPETEVKMIAMCGLVCTECEAYIATKNNDQAAKEEVAKKWSEMYGAEVTVKEVTCDGCQSTTGRLSSYASSMCEVRTCALEKQVTNCAHCQEYACEKLTEFYKIAPEAKKVLDEIHAKT